MRVCVQFLLCQQNDLSAERWVGNTLSCSIPPPEGEEMLLESTWVEQRRGKQRVCLDVTRHILMTVVQVSAGAALGLVCMVMRNGNANKKIVFVV